MSVRFLVKIVVAMGLFGLVASRVDFNAALRIVRNADLLLVLLAVAVSLAIVLADAAFWSRSMKIVGCRIAFRPALVFSLVGWFFANLAPSTIGSDLFRAAQMRYAGAGIDASVRIVAAARLMSLASLLLVIGAGLPLALWRVGDALERWALVGVFAAALICFAAFLTVGPTLGGARRLTFIASLAADTKAMVLKLTPGGWFFLTVQHLLRVAGVVLIAAAVDASADVAALFALVPAALLIAMVPISIGGWGVREASFVHFLGFADVDPATALAISIVYGLTRALIGAAGGVLWIAAGRDRYAFSVDGRRRKYGKRRPDEARIAKWCPEEDSNLHALQRQHLKLVRLPIPPSGHWGADIGEALARCQ